MAAKKGTVSVVCNSNGCVFLKTGLTRKQADFEATCHMKGSGHSVSTVDMAVREAAQVKSFGEFIEEDAAVNSAGGGAVAGLGVGPQGEPGGIPKGGTPKKKRKEDYSIEDMLDEDYAQISGHHISRLRHLQSELGRVRFGLSQNPKSRSLKKEEGSHLRRITREFNRLLKSSEQVKQLQEAGPSDTFAGADVFDVTTEKFMTSRFGKNRYHRYSRYVGEDETGESIRQHGRNTKRDIILKDGTTGAMLYLRRKGTNQS